MTAKRGCDGECLILAGTAGDVKAEDRQTETRLVTVIQRRRFIMDMLRTAGEDHSLVRRLVRMAECRMEGGQELTLHICLSCQSVMQVCWITVSETADVWSSLTLPCNIMPLIHHREGHA